MRRQPLKPILASLLLVQLLLAGAVQGQRNQTTPLTPTNILLTTGEIKINTLCDQMQQLVVTILDDKLAHLDRQAVVKLYDRKRQTVTWATTSDQAEAAFCNIESGGDFDLEASAVGYFTEYREWHATNLLPERSLKIVLRPDPTAIELNAADDDIPPHARKDAKRAVAALKSGNFKEAQKRLQKLSIIAPGSVHINFLLGFLFVQLKDFEKAEPYLSQAVSLAPRRVQAMTLLGRVQLERKEYGDARKTLERAVNADPTSWMAHNLLADTLVRLKDYKTARKQAESAINEGGISASAAQLVLGQALANLGQDTDAIHALNTFVKSNPGNSAIPAVQAFIAKIENRHTNGTADLETGPDLALAATVPALPESAWGPPGVDDAKPAVAPEVSCPSQQVIEGAGERVKQFAENIAKFAAVEDLTHEQLDKFGRPISKEDRKFNYVAAITQERSGFLKTSEYRDLRYGLTDLPDHIVTTGFMALALIFHPDQRDGFDMTCEGLGDWHGQPAWLVHFRERDDRPNRFAEYVVDNQKYPVKLKGRAWITADNLQIVRIESDLVKPLPQLSVEHQIAEYGPVEFKEQSVQLWLPQAVDIYLELNRHYYYRRHSFDHFMLFSVNSIDKPKIFNPPDPVPKDISPDASAPTPN
jgi:tetratricopeptide (TPR) repeat protein